MEFGYLPRHLDFAEGDISIVTMPGLEQQIEEVMKSGFVEGDWIFAPPMQCQDIFSGKVRSLPRSGRIFGLPKTHVLHHASSNDPEHLKFLLWLLGFVLGVRLTDTEAGFLDATPIVPDKLHDFACTKRNQQKAIGIADAFWQRHRSNARIVAGLTGAINILFLSQMPSLLDFEIFTYVYIALDGCYALWTNIHGNPPKRLNHHQRVEYLCDRIQRPVPDWAGNNPRNVAGVRNDTLHEGLFFDAPLGFQVFGGNSRAGTGHRNILLEMQNLICRFICAVVGFNDAGYINSGLDTRGRFGLEL